MTHDEHRERQEAVLTKVLAILQAEPTVLGVVATGSYARGRHDAFSDLDLDCYLSDEERSARPKLHDAVAAVEPLLCRLWLYDLHALYLYANGVRLDLNYSGPGALTELVAGCRVLYDPSCRLAAAVAAASPEAGPADPYWAGEQGNQQDWLFWMMRQVYCWARRGAQGGPRAYSKLANGVQSLSELRGALVTMRLWTLGESYYLARADAACAARMAETYPHLQADEICAATRALLREYEIIGPEFCRKHGLAFAAAKVAAMWRLFDEFDSLG